MSEFGKGEYVVELGKGKGSYRKKWVFTDRNKAVRYYNGLNVHSGFKKRLTKNGEVLARIIT